MKRQKKRSNTGFTLVEVLFFMAISSLLVFIVFAGMGSRIRNVSFSAGVRDLQETISGQFSAASMGENKGGALRCQFDGSGRILLSEDAGVQPGGQGGCVIMGRVIAFRETELDIYHVIGRRVPVTSSANCQWRIGELHNPFLNCYKPIVRYTGDPSQTSPGGIRLIFAASDEKYQYKHGIRVASTDAKGRDLVFGYVQNPNGTDRYQFFYFGSYADLSAASVVQSDPVASRDGRVCLQLDGRDAMLQFTTNKIEPELTFGDPWC